MSIRLHTHSPLRPTALSVMAPATVFFTPFLVYAQTWGTFLDRLMSFLNMVLPILIALAIVFFFLGVVRFIQAEESTQKNETKGILLYGVIAIFVMLSIWGLVNLLLNTVFQNPVSDTAIQGSDIPQFPTAP